MGKGKHLGYLNLPQPGKPRASEPIRSVEAIKNIKKLLKGRPRDLLLFTMGINTGLRVKDLLALKVKDIKELGPGDVIDIIETKRGKPNIIVINKEIYKVLWMYIRTEDLKDDDWLFRSERPPHGPLIIQSVQRLIKQWTREVGLKGRYGCHSLRKTWGYMQRTRYKVGWEMICKRYNHSNPDFTMRYLGITQQEIKGILMHNI